MVDYVSSEVTLEEGTSGIIPVTAWDEYEPKKQTIPLSTQTNTHFLFDTKHCSYGFFEQYVSSLYCAVDVKLRYDEVR